MFLYFKEKLTKSWKMKVKVFHFLCYFGIIVVICSKKEWTLVEVEFHSQEELFQRVTPALHARCGELAREGYSDINSLDIWNYFIQSKWSVADDLMLSDIVHDIMHVEYDEIRNFLDGEETDDFFE